MSILLPTHRAGSEIGQGGIRLKNALREAGERLDAAGVRPPVAERLLAPAAERTDDLEFWRHQGDGLAIYLADGVEEMLRLPVDLEELVVVGGRFHVSPLVEAMSRRSLLLLALSRGSTRLYEVGDAALVPVEIDAPTDIADASWFADREQALQLHATRRGGAATFHGHDPEEDEQEDVHRYLLAVSRAVASHANPEGAPVLVAAVEELAAAYRDVAEHPVLETTLAGNPDGWSPSELHRSAAEVARGLTDEERRVTLERLTEALGRGEAVVGVADTLEAARMGRLDVVLAEAGDHVWGRWDDEALQAAVHDERRPEDEDLVDRALGATLEQGGEAWMVERLPVEASVAGIPRF